jgi:exo-1,4-beta-D-glucosaminidase
MTNRYGRWSSLASYVEEAQLQNYETQRAEFEAYIDHSTRRRAPSTGIVYWQLNKGWPTLLWDLYNHDSDQAGSYFGAKKANEKLHVLYAYDTGSVTVDNLGRSGAARLTVQARVYDVSGHLLSSRAAHGLSLASGGVATNVLHPAVPAATAPPTRARTYFVALLLRRGHRVLDRNVYWLSTQPDVVDWPKTMGQPQATMIRYASLAQLRKLRAATLRVVAHTRRAHGPDGADTMTEVTITNVSHTPTVAFFLRADVRRGSRTGVPASGANQVLPIFFDDNDITLWPGESQTLHATYRRVALRGASPVVSVSGFKGRVINVPGL